MVKAEIVNIPIDTGQKTRYIPVSLMEVRLHKFMADYGVASRRQSEKMILAGEVTVNGRVVREMGFKITPGKDAIKVNGKLLHTKAKNMYIALYKPKGVLTTLNDPEGRPTVKDLLVGVHSRVFPIGRLDYESEGLLVLTNDGEYAQKLTHPKEPINKVYLVKVEGKPNQRQLDRLKAGVSLIDGKARAKEITRIRTGEQYDWFRIVLNEGGNRQIRGMFLKIGFDVLKLQRIAIGKLTLKKMQRGQFRVMTESEARLALQ